MMTKNNSSTDQPIRLSFRETQNQVFVESDDEDRFFMVISNAAKACKRYEDVLHFRKRIDELLEHVHAWALTHKGVIAEVVMTFGVRGMQVYVVTKGPDYRFDFEDVITEFDIQLSREFGDVPTHVMHIPQENAEVQRAFFSPETAMQVYAD